MINSAKILITLPFLLIAALITDTVVISLPKIATTEEKAVSALLVDLAALATFLTVRTISKRITRQEKHRKKLSEVSIIGPWGTYKPTKELNA